MQLSNAELYLGEAGMSPVYWVLSEDEGPLNLCTMCSATRADRRQQPKRL